MADLKDKIAACCRVLYAEGHADMNLGHVSAREPGAPSIWMKPGGVGLEETAAENLVELNIEGEKQSGESKPPGEWPLHTEVYRARQDVNCVIHTHPLWTVVFGIVGLPFQVVNQDGVVVEGGLRYFSGSAELITTKEQGKLHAHDLGDGRMILLRNHGVTLVSSSIEECLVLALNLEKALQVQLLAAMCGGPRHLVDPALALQMGKKFLSNQKRTLDLFAYNVRKAERILASMEPRS